MTNKIVLSTELRKLIEEYPFSINDRTRKGKTVFTYLNGPDDREMKRIKRGSLLVGKAIQSRRFLSVIEGSDKKLDVKEEVSNLVKDFGQSILEDLVFSPIPVLEKEKLSQHLIEGKLSFPVDAARFAFLGDYDNFSKHLKDKKHPDNEGPRLGTGDIDFEGMLFISHWNFNPRLHS